MKSIVFIILIILSGWIMAEIGERHRFDLKQRELRRLPNLYCGMLYLLNTLEYIIHSTEMYYVCGLYPETVDQSNCPLQDYADSRSIITKLTFIVAILPLFWLGCLYFIILGLNLLTSVNPILTIDILVIGWGYFCNYIADRF